MFRLLAAWLVLASLPLQGIAAASMLYCHQAVAAAVTVQGDHSGHDQGRHASAAAHDGHASDHGQAADPGDADHKCPVCGGLCHVMGIPESTPVAPSADAPPAELPQPRALALTRAPPRPDKPPRA